MTSQAARIGAVALFAIGAASAGPLAAQNLPVDSPSTPDSTAAGGTVAPLPGAPQAAPSARGGEAERPLPRWRSSGTWREDYDARHDGRRYRQDGLGALQQPSGNAVEPNRWGQADPRNPAHAAGGAPTGRFATPREWGDEGGWDRGIWAGRGGDWRRPR